jgi:Rrf2 family protein
VSELRSSFTGEIEVEASDGPERSITPFSMISRKGKYGIRALLYIARQPASVPVSTEQIASSEGIPRKFLEAIMLDLKLGGLVHSSRGKGGGYTLQKNPKRITIGQILCAVDGPIAPVPCVSATSYAPCTDCPEESTCSVRLVMLEVREAISRVVDLKTLEALQEETSARAPHDSHSFQI